MARKRKHEDHINHQAWAIPFGDLMTLLLAFFVVMYAISSINEGKFRVLSDSLQAAFRGVPRTLEPVNVGEKTRGSGADIAVSIVQQATIDGQPRQMLEAISLGEQLGKGLRKRPEKTSAGAQIILPPALGRVADEIEKALAPLVAADMIAVRRESTWVEVEIRTDILFASGVADLSAAALPPSTFPPNAAMVSEPGARRRPPTIAPSTRPIPIELGLSAARAASVVHLFAKGGVDPARLAVIGLGEFRPAKSNDTVEGRNANRRVLIVILGDDQAPEHAFGKDPGASDGPAQPGESAQPEATPIQPIATAAVGTR
jgi:chemotaxis protein MotB